MPEAVTLETLATSYNQADGALGVLLEKYQSVAEEKIPLDDRKELNRLNVECAKIQSDINEHQFDGGIANLGSQRLARQEQLRTTSKQPFVYGAEVPRNETEALNMAAKTLGTEFVETTLIPWLQRVSPMAAKGGAPTTDRMPDSPSLAFAQSMKVRAWSHMASMPSTNRSAAAKALITGTSAWSNASTSAGTLVRPDYDAYVPLPRRPLFFRDLVRERTITSDVVFYPKFTARSNAAVPVAEATTQSNGAKPESSLTLAVETETVKTIATWMAVSRRALSDAGQIRQIIDEELRGNVEESLENEMLSGDGTGEHFLGVEHLVGTTDVVFDTDIKTTIRHMRTAAIKTPAYILSAGAMRVNRGNVAILMNPDDVEEYDLDQDAEARYYTGGPVQVYAPMAWGIPIVESEAVTAGNAWMADWTVCTLHDREDTVIRMSESHSDWFIRNLIALLAEGRWAFTCGRPSGVIKGALA